MSNSTNDNEAPYCVALVAMGPSHKDYLAECVGKAGRLGVADETWAIGAMAGIIQHDRAFLMDALPSYAKRARTEPYLEGYGRWLHLHPGPIYTQREYEGFPGSVAYPLEAVLNSVRFPYFNNTTAYAIAFAIHLKVRHLKVYGLDFTNNENRGFAEAGRACAEYWLSFAVQRGIKVDIAPSSTLLDQHNRQLYGYSVQPTITHVNGQIKVTHNAPV